MAIKINIDENFFNKTYLENNNLYDYSHRWEIYYGGAGSGKSYYIADKLIIKALRSTRRIMICRKSGTTLQHSVMDLIKDELKRMGIYEYCECSDYKRSYKLPNGSEFIFKSLDQETKLLSLQDIGDIWVK